MIDIDYLKDIMCHVDLLPFSIVSDITNNLSSDNLFPSISGCSDFGSNDLNTILASSVTYTIIQYEDGLVAREIINNKQNNGKMFYDRIVDAKNVFLRLCC